jgi:hypothetical protein
MVADNIKAGLMTLCLGGIGDIISRVVWYNCSVNKAWTMLFFMPPLSIVSAIFYFLDKVEKGAMKCGDSFDWFMYAIPIMSICVNFFLPYLFEDEDSILPSILSVVTMFVMYAVIRMYKTTNSCNTIFREKSKGFNINIVKRALLISLITNSVIFAFNSISPFLEFVPIVGTAFSIWGFLDYIPGLQHALLLTLSHFIINLNENSRSTIENVCIA